MSQIQAIYGVDFSGAVNAGAHIWIAQIEQDGERFQVREIVCAASLAGSSAARAEAHSALRTFIAQQRSALFGLDFPFSLHRSQVAAQTWEAFVLDFGRRFPDADAFYRQQGGKGREQRRTTDLETHTPFAPTNLRMVRQTYYGIRDVLAPLVRDGAAVVFPMQALRADTATLIEICPAVTLARLGLRLPGYKGPGAAARSQRERLVAGLKATSIFLAPEQEALVLDNAGGDALDSIIAALGTAFALRSGATTRAYDDDARIEGVVFA